MVDSNPIKPTSEDTPDRTIYECTGCGTVTRDRVAQMVLYKRAGALSCCPERNMVPVQSAERALVMPDPKPVPVYQVAPLAAESAIGWNNALREVARLNGTRSAQTEQQPSAAHQILDLILDQCRYWHGRDEARRGGFACLYAAAKEVVDHAR